MRYSTAAYGINSMVAAKDQVAMAKAAQEAKNSLSSEAGEDFFDENKQKEYLKSRRKASASIVKSMIATRDQKEYMKLRRKANASIMKSMIAPPDQKEYMKLRRKANANIMKSMITGHTPQKFDFLEESEESCDEFRKNMYNIVSVSDQETQKKIGSHVGIKPSQIEYMFVKLGGCVECLRHFIAVDHKKKTVVISIRGTFSVTGILIDLTFYTGKFMMDLRR